MNAVVKEYSDRVVEMERRRDALTTCSWREIIRACTSACAIALNTMLHSTLDENGGETTAFAIKAIEINLGLADKLVRAAVGDVAPSFLEFEPGTWWWHAEPDGRRVMYPLMTLEALDPPPITDASIFRCVRCKFSGTYEELQERQCTDPVWYHGNVRWYRQTHDRMHCIACDHDWIVQTWYGFAKRNCPRCTGVYVEKIR